MQKGLELFIKSCYAIEWKVGYIQPIGDRAIPGQVVVKTLPPTSESEHSYWLLVKWQGI
jgi:hypothetical protein